MNIEQRMEQVERQTKRLRIAVVVLAAALCGVVSMAATEGENGYFENVFAKRFVVMSDKDEIAVVVGSGDDGGAILTLSPTGERLVELSHTDNGGSVRVYNKAGGENVILSQDQYGNGEVGVFDRKGQGRAYKSQ